LLQTGVFEIVHYEVSLEFSSDRPLLHWQRLQVQAHILDRKTANINVKSVPV